MADNKKYLKNLIYALFVMAAVFVFSPVSVCAEEEDWIEIVSVTPNSYDNNTDSVTFTATINYSLQSAEQGIVYLGFNTSQPNYYEIEEEPGAAGQVVSRGTGTVVLSKEVTPVNWDTAISRMQQYMQGISYPVTDFKIYANISEYPHDIPWMPLAIYEAVLTELPETELGADEASMGKEIEEFHSCGNNLTWKLEDGMLTIEGIGDMADFNPYHYSSTPAPPWIESRSAITKVVIGSGVTSIGTYAFWGCDNLINVDIPNSVISIGDNAFWACKSLASISIPNSVINIGEYAFQACGFSTVTVPSGVTSISNGMFMECENLSSVIFMEGVARIEVAPFEYCFSLQSLTIPKSVTYIDGSLFSRCPDLGDIYYGGSEEDWKKINTSLDMEGMYWYVRIHYNAISSEGAALPETKAEYKVYCGEGYPNGYEIFDCSLEDCLSKKDSDTYNPQLAHMLIAMCNSVYDGTNIEETFNSFGFRSEDTDKSYDMERMLLAYGMAKKQIVRAGNEKTLILIVARGTEALEEWKSNIDILTNNKNQHEGFAEAANALYDRMIGEEFLGTFDFSNMEFVITGFSRGAAVANILAARLVDEGVAQSCIHAYTFACPDTIKITDRTAGRYGCIFNIADARDYVSWVPRMYLGDEWNKYGQSYWYCEDWNDYQNLEMNMLVYHDPKKYLEYLRSERSDSEYWDRGRAKKALDAADRQRRLDILKNVLYVRGYRKANVSYSGVWCPVDVEIRTSDGRLAGRW